MKNQINFKTLFFLLPLFVVCFFSCAERSDSEIGWNQVPKILKQIVPPTFPDNDFNVIDYGAVPDGETYCTDAFREAIQDCHKSGGGRVVVPEGKYLTGAIHLKSKVNLHIEKDATILFSKDKKKYLPVVFTRYEGTECYNYSPFIYAFEQENIGITGKGTLDGQAGSDNWWNWKGKNDPQVYDRTMQDVNLLRKMAEEGVPVKERVFGAGHFLRVKFIQPYRCKNILIEGITVLRSPMWQIHPVLCENVTVNNVTVNSHGYNNDGCNPESCKNVLIKDCFFNTGDDCIAIKSGRNADGRRVNVPSENIIVQGCTMKDGHGGVVIGSEISGNCRNVFAEDCVMDSPNLKRALRIKTNSKRGGIVENIFMRNVTVGEVADAVIKVNFHYSEGDVGEHTPMVRNIYVNKVTSEKSEYAFYFDGYKRSPITNINIESCTFNGVEKDNLINNVSDLKLKEVYLNGQLQM